MEIRANDLRPWTSILIGKILTTEMCKKHQHGFEFAYVQNAVTTVWQHST